MRTFLSLALLVCFSAAGCSNAPTAPTTMTTLSSGSEGFSGSTSAATSLATVKPGGKPTRLNLKGIVSAVDPAAKTITVSSRVIAVPDAAHIVDALETPLTFGDITVGKRVHITATTLGTVTTASVVRVLDFAVAGTVADLTGTCPTLAFTVSSQNVATTGTTEFARGDCAKIALDMVVTVEGTLDAGLLAALRVELPKNVPPSKPPKNVRLRGAISLATGTCPAKTFTVADKEVRTDASTTFTGSGKCAAVADGKTVDVTGVEMAGYVRAVRLNVSKK